MDPGSSKYGNEGIFSGVRRSAGKMSWTLLSFLTPTYVHMYICTDSVKRIGYRRWKLTGLDIWKEFIYLRGARAYGMEGIRFDHRRITSISLHIFNKINWMPYFCLSLGIYQEQSGSASRSWPSSMCWPTYPTLLFYPLRKWLMPRTPLQW
jgi:hypothetical protein